MRKNKYTLGLPTFHIGISIYFPLSFYSNNIHLFNPAEFAFFASALFLISLAVMKFLGLFLKPEKSAIIVFLICIACLVPGFYSDGGVVVLIVVMLLILATIRFNINPIINVIINVFVTSLISIQIYNLITFHMQDLAQSEQLKDAGTLKNKFDIYHIVLDGYNGNPALKEFYNFDNSGFTDELKELGFTIYNNATSPYNQTLPTMSSIFNIGYTIEEKSKDSHVPLMVWLYHMGSSGYNGVIPRYLRENNYNFYFTPQGYRFLSFPNEFSVNKNHSDNVNIFASEYMKQLWWVKHLFRLESGTGIHQHTINALNYNDFKSLESPLFYYSHILSPHPPFNIDRDGNITDRYPSFANSINDGSDATGMKPELIAEYKKGYVEKLIFTNKKLIDLTGKIINSNNNRKVIILHGDHGGGSSMNYASLNDTCVMERYKPFLAIYRTGGNGSEHGEEFPLINIYRELMTEWTDLKLPPLPSRTFFMPWGQPEKLQEFDIEEHQGECKH